MGSIEEEAFADFLEDFFEEEEGRVLRGGYWPKHLGVGDVDFFSSDRDMMLDASLAEVGRLVGMLYWQ